MKCPACDELLVMTERQGVEIDYCPVCRGVWLDKGELDKIIERSGRESTHSYKDEKQPYREDESKYKQPYQGKRKKGGFLEDLFDF
ncbi:MAG TPA: zf-TFIIB domain-containing protein [Chitinophagaceae bacterium]|nr:zf-TFIIB domain-containing protein [Chitinophagaceae bacterium]